MIHSYMIVNRGLEFLQPAEGLVIRDRRKLVALQIAPIEIVDPPYDCQALELGGAIIFFGPI